MSITAGKLKHMKALSNEEGVIAAAAMDQRGSLQKSLAAAKGVDAKAITPEMMQDFKIAVTKVLTPHASAILRGANVQEQTPGGGKEQRRFGSLDFPGDSGFVPETLPVDKWGCEDARVAVRITERQSIQFEDQACCRPCSAHAQALPVPEKKFRQRWRLLSTLEPSADASVLAFSQARQDLAH